MHRFYSEVLKTHLFTVDETEKAHLENEPPEVWRYEGVAFYVPAAYRAGTLPVYRFYSEDLKVHRACAGASLLQRSVEDASFHY